MLNKVIKQKRRLNFRKQSRSILLNVSSSISILTGMPKWVWIIFELGICIFILFCCSFSGGNHKVENPKSLSVYDTPYTYMQKNDDGTYSLYIFSSPIQYQEDGIYKRIDNALIDSEQKDCIAENKGNVIKTYFPKDLSSDFMIVDGKDKVSFSLKNVDEKCQGKRVEYTNLYGDKKEAVCYNAGENTAIYAYPLNSGIHFEYVINGENKNDLLPDIKFNIRNAELQNETEEYVCFERGFKKDILIYQPAVMADGSKKLYTGQNWNAEIGNKQFFLKAKCSHFDEEEKMHVEFSIQMHQEDIPDTTVYEKKNKNTYLSNYAVVGTDTPYEQGLHYQRYRLNYFFETSSDQIIDANYYVRLLNQSNENQELKMYASKEQWSSTQMVWNDRTLFDENNVYAVGEMLAHNWMQFSLKEFVKDAVDDQTWMLESYGSVLSADQGYAVLASSDNGEYIPYLKIDFKSLPYNFHPHLSVNQFQ